MLTSLIKAGRRVLAGLIFSGVLVPATRAQYQSVVTVSTPNAMAFDKFNNVPVDLFTGVPDINVPLHTVTYGTIHVPVNLRYHPGAVRAGSHPGWVGTGWDLEAGGSITRTLRRGVDEDYINDNPSAMGGINAYYPWPGQPSSGSGADLLNASDWGSTAKLQTYFSTTIGGAGADVEADEFSFSFMGHSGKFYYQTGVGWQVVSDENIKVQLNASPDDFLSADDVNALINSYSGINNVIFNNTTIQTRAFKKFTLTTPDGTKYVFGGANAVEFNCTYTANNPGPLFIADRWLLVQVIDPYNNEVDFNYARTYGIAELSCGRTNFDYDCTSSSKGFYNPSGGAIASETGTVNANQYGGYFHWPVYLTSVTTPNETVSFTSSVATCLRFSNLQFFQVGSTSTGEYIKAILNNNLDNLQWMKLDNIKIRNNRQRVLKQYQLTYNNNASQRLALNSVAMVDAVGTTIGEYSFSYNNIGGLPLYDGNHMDHWGFFNNKDLNGIDVHSAYSYRTTDATVVTTGLLTQITYPTGGNTQLTWEAHDYSQFVSTNRTQLLPQSSAGDVYVGGSRVSAINSYLPDGSLAYQKKYVYKRGYTSGANLSSLTPSGILNGVPQYIFDVTGRQGVNGDATFDVHWEYLNPIGNYSYNNSDSYIGYDEVAEIERDGSYTRHFFTSYGPDYNGVSHFDQAPVGYIGWQPGTDIYVPMTNLDRERGKLVASLYYTSSDVLLKKTVNTYRNDAARFNQFVKIIEDCPTGLISVGACASDAVIFATANKKYTYTYYPVTQTVTNYDQSGSNPVTETTTFTYNQNNLVSSKTLTNSKGELVTHLMQYTTEGTDAASGGMVAAHMLNYLLLDSMFKTPPGQSAIVQQVNKTIYYSPASGLYTKLLLQQQNGSNILETRHQFYQYDAHGNVQEESPATDMHTVYLWSYNFQYPVARIENSTYSAVSALITQSSIDGANSSDASMRSLFAALRTQLPGAQVTSFTYSPVYGMTSETDPQGRNKYYDYDNFGRLIAIRDQDANIVKRYCYNYAGQPEACGLYYNQTQSNSFSPVCPPGFVGSPVTYSVPAGVYTGTSQGAANQMATNDLNLNGPVYAQQNSPCQMLYYNVEEDGTFTKNVCGANMTGQTMTYVVPAGTYSTTAGQDAANQLAKNDVAANGQNWVNQNGACTCNYTTIVLTIAPGSTVNGYRAILTDGNGVNTSWNFPSTGSSTVTTTFPSGTYSIGIAPTGGPGSNHTFTWAQGPNGGTISNATSANFGNQQVQCQLTLTIY